MFRALNFVLAGVLVHIANRNIWSAIQRSKAHEAELTEKNLELEDIRSSLEQRVALRTAEINQQKQFYEALVKNSPIAIVSLDLQQQIVSCNPAFESLFGYTQDEVAGQVLDDLVATEQTRAEAIHYTQRVQQGETLHCTGQRSTKNGRLITVEIFGVPVIVDGGQIGILGLYNDITERKQAEEYLQYLATHDSLTVLPNRSYYYQRLGLALQLANWKHDQVAVIFLDLDGFKSVNDQFGHEQGDLLLQMVAERLHDYLRHSDFVARLGGDEFAFIFENVRKPGDAAVIAEKILKVISQPFYVKEHRFSITASIGICLAPGDGKEPEILLKNADAAMYRAKESGKNQFRFFGGDQ
jgi:diguanylate cyclase (GGDEF)-like protein/PAS domain S-box-containing protein